ncbi:MAG: cyclodeaminase/cyclohydrolase family protein [Bdellovibrionota bacterium]
MIIDASIREYLDRLGSRDSVPGGGAAAAFSASQGIALFLMVAELSKKSAELDLIIKNCNDALKAFADLADEDMREFSEVMTAMQLPKKSEEDKNKRTLQLQVALKAAANVPLSVIKLCSQCLEWSAPIAMIGNKNVLSDMAVGLYLIKAAIQASAVNVHINLKYIKDQEFINDTHQKLDYLYESSSKQINSQLEGIKNVINIPLYI